MKIIIDIVLLAIIALCTWGGYKKGVVGGVAGILAIVIALLGGSLLSSTYSGEIIPAFEPFIDGFIDSQNTRSAILEDMGYGSSDYSLEDILGNDETLRYDYAYDCMLVVGFHDSRAAALASSAVVAMENGEADNMTQAVVNVICSTVTYVGCYTVAFLLILMFLIAIANIGNLSFRLPNMENLDEIGGAAIGFVKGFLYCILLCWLLSFFGIIIGKTTLNNTTLARFFLAFKFITNGLM